MSRNKNYPISEQLVKIFKKNKANPNHINHAMPIQRQIEYYIKLGIKAEKAGITLK